MFLYIRCTDWSCFSFTHNTPVSLKTMCTVCTVRRGTRKLNCYVKTRVGVIKYPLVKGVEKIVRAKYLI